MTVFFFDGGGGGVIIILGFHGPVFSCWANSPISLLEDAMVIPTVISELIDLSRASSMIAIIYIWFKVIKTTLVPRLCSGDQIQGGERQRTAWGTGVPD